MNKILHLTLKKKWFDLIKSGEKKVEYREIKPYWEKRLCEIITIYNTGRRDYLPKTFDKIRFRNGYSKNCPVMDVEWEGMGIMVFEGKRCFAIKLGKIIK